MGTFEIGFGDFMIEIKRWKLTSESLYKVKAEDLGNFYRFSFCLPNTQEEYVTTINKENLTEVDKMELLPITISARRISENITSAQMIVNKLNEIGEKNAFSTFNNKG